MVAMSKGKRDHLKPFGTTLPESLIEDLKREVLILKRTNPRVTIASIVEQSVREFIRHNETEREKVL